MIPLSIKIKNNSLPDTPGVYLMKDAEGTVLYVGKAVNLKRRVHQHFERPHNESIEEMTHHVVAIDYIEKPSAMEALILEANLIKYYWPKYNIKDKDNKTFLYLAITKEDFPKPVLIRGSELDAAGPKAYKAVFGPYTSPNALRASLDLLRKTFPWSTCEPGQPRPCFYHHLGQCPGVCVNAIDKKAYGKIIRDLIRFFGGKKDAIIKSYRRDMAKASKERRFEDAAVFRNRIHSLEHIKDVAILKRENENVDKIRSGEVVVNLFGRIEGYDISNISGTSSVASMVVFEDGAPAKGEYRSFRIKTVQGANDVASLAETLMRRFRHLSPSSRGSKRGSDWRRPDLILIDGGLPQVHAAEAVVHHLDLGIPVVGIAKGPERKRVDLVCSKTNLELCRLCEEHLDLLVQVRDEAHRFAIGYHRRLRGKNLFGPAR